MSNILNDGAEIIILKIWKGWILFCTHRTSSGLNLYVACNTPAIVSVRCLISSLPTEFVSEDTSVPAVDSFCSTFSTENSVSTDFFDVISHSGTFSDAYPVSENRFLYPSTIITFLYRISVSSSSSSNQSSSFVFCFVVGQYGFLLI